MDWSNSIPFRLWVWGVNQVGFLRVFVFGQVLVQFIQGLLNILMTGLVYLIVRTDIKQFFGQFAFELLIELKIRWKLLSIFLDVFVFFRLMIPVTQLLIMFLCFLLLQVAIVPVCWLGLCLKIVVYKFPIRYRKIVPSSIFLFWLVFVLDWSWLVNFLKSFFICSLTEGWGF